MGRRKTVPYDADDEFFAQIEFLRNDYDQALETIEQQKVDIRILLSLLIKEDIAIPEELIDRYIRKISASEETNHGLEGLPFD